MSEEPKEQFSKWALAKAVGMWLCEIPSLHKDQLRYKIGTAIIVVCMDYDWHPFTDPNQLELCYRLAEFKCVYPAGLGVDKREFDHIFRLNLHDAMAQDRFFSADLGTVWVQNKAAFARAIYQTVQYCEQCKPKIGAK